MARRQPAEKTFMRITNSDIYNEIKEMKEQEAKRHEAVIAQIELANRKSTKALIVASLGMTIIIITLTVLIEHLAKP